MQRLQLHATKRELFGRKVNRLRNDGILPGNIYGNAVESLAVQIPLKEFFLFCI